MSQYNNSDSDEDWNGWESDQEGDDYAVPTPDLFSPELIHPSPKVFKQYTLLTYNLNLDQVFKDLKLNTYNRIGLINFLRSQPAGSLPRDGTVVQFITESKPIWYGNEDFLLPTIQNDGLIQYAATLAFGFESDGEEWDEDSEDAEDITDEDDEESDDRCVILHQKQTISQLTRQIDELESLLSRSRTALYEYALSADNTSITPTATLEHIPSPLNLEDPTDMKDQAQYKDNEKLYFASYSDRLIHEVMLQDKHRTLSYRQAFISLKNFVNGKVVLDVGCGTGILSMFAAQNGAKLVIGVDAADIIDKTREIIKKNGFEDKILLVKGKVEEVVLPIDTVDIIVSEWMGYYLLYESMLPSVFYARNKWLRRGPENNNISLYEAKKQQNLHDSENYSLLQPTSNISFHQDTRIFPDIARMFVAGSNVIQYRNKYLNFWKDVYDFDMSCLVLPRDAYPSSFIDVIQSNEVATSNEMYGCWDLMKCEPQQLTFNTENIVISIEKTGNDIIDSFIVWFDTPFTIENNNNDLYTRDISTLSPQNLPVDPTHDNNTDKDAKYKHIVLTTSPYHSPTHWQQSIFRLQHIIKGKVGDKINLAIKSTPRKDNVRHYDVEISYTFIPHGDFDNTILTQNTDIPNTQFAAPNTTYTQKYSLQ